MTSRKRQSAGVIGAKIVHVGALLWSTVRIPKLKVGR